jgi:hypothetical protein
MLCSSKNELELQSEGKSDWPDSLYSCRLVSSFLITGAVSSSQLLQHSNRARHPDALQHGELEIGSRSNDPVSSSIGRQVPGSPSCRCQSLSKMASSTFLWARFVGPIWLKKSCRKDGDLAYRKKQSSFSAAWSLAFTHTWFCLSALSTVNVRGCCCRWRVNYLQKSITYSVIKAPRAEKKIRGGYYSYRLARKR